jgi:hypothetical protein
VGRKWEEDEMAVGGCMPIYSCRLDNDLRAN